MLQERNNFAFFQCPNMRHANLAGGSGFLVIPSVPSIGNHGFAVGNDSVDGNSPVVAKVAKAHKYSFDNRLGPGVSPGEWEAIGFDPGNIIRKPGNYGFDITRCETGVEALNDLFVGHRDSLLWS
jgi:hypothetical protein